MSLSVLVFHQNAAHVGAYGGWEEAAWDASLVVRPRPLQKKLATSSLLLQPPPTPHRLPHVQHPDEKTSSFSQHKKAGTHRAFMLPEWSASFLATLGNSMDHQLHHPVLMMLLSEASPSIFPKLMVPM